MLVGMTVYTGQYWADQRKLSKEQLAALIVNLAWNGLSRMEAKPELRFESGKARKDKDKVDKDNNAGESSAPPSNDGADDAVTASSDPTS